MIRLGVAVALVTLALSGAREAHAHPLDTGALRVQVTGTAVAVTLDLDVDAVPRLAAVPAGAIAAHADALAAASFARRPLVTAAGPCTWSGFVAAQRGRTITLQGHARCPAAGALRWSLPFVAAMPSTFQLLVRAGTQVVIVDAARTELALDGGRLAFADLVWTGIEHIGAAPGEWHDAAGWKLADGIDHILFLIALMLAGGTLLQLVGLTTGFTVGHSITLAISALGIARPPASVVEPIIALSIAVAAAEAITGRFRRYRWQLAAGFGLVHGFGFAGALADLELARGDLVTALVGYNLGVELGQVAIVLVTAPLILLAHRHPRARRIIPAIAAAICAAGLYWFVERVTGA